MKKSVIINVLAVVIIVLKMLVQSLGLEQMGAMGYVLFDMLGIVVILFGMNYIAGVWEGEDKKIIVNAVTLVVLQLIISGTFGYTTIGREAEKKLDQMIVQEQNVNENIDEGIEISFSEGNASSGILNHGFYFVAALAGGKMGLKVKENKKKKDNQGMGF